MVEVIIFVLTVVLAMLDSSQWPGAFFWTTMGSVVILNSKTKINTKTSSITSGNSRLFMFTVAGGIYQNTVYGMAAKLPFKYTGAVVLGSVSFLKKGQMIFN